MSKSSTALAFAALAAASGGVAFASRAPASAIEIPASVPGRGGATYDFGSLRSIGVETLETCLKPYRPDAVTQSGHTIKMLGAAYVYMGPSNGFSVLGHAAERFVYCRDREVFDAVYEYSKPDPLMMDLDANFEKEYGISLADYSDEEKAKIRDSLYVTVTFNPSEYYAMEQTRVHRTIYESWFDLDGETQYKMLAANATRYQDQARRIRAHEPLPEYRAFKANCATPVKDDLAIANPAFLAKHRLLPVTPGYLFKKVRRQGAKVKKTIVYPSQRLLRMIRLKQAGKSRLFEGFVPLSKTLKHAFPGSWTLLYDDGSSPWRKMLLTPVYGTVNFAAGVVSTTYGLATAPVRLIGRIAKSEGLRKIGLGRLKHGLRDMMMSAGEIFTLQLRHPVATPWTEEEMEFFRGLQQNSALLEFMRAEWEKAPLVVRGEAGDAIADPAPAEAPVDSPDRLLEPELSRLE